MPTRADSVVTPHLPDHMEAEGRTATEAGFVLTRRFFVFLLLGLVPLGLVWLDGRMVWIALFYDTILISAAGLDLWRSEKAREIAAWRIFDPPIGLGFPNSVVIAVRHRGSRPLKLVIVDETPAETEAPPEYLHLTVPSASMGWCAYVFHPSRRGPVRFGDINLRVEGPLRLVARQMRIAAGEEVRVYPDLRGARQLDLQLRQGAAMAQGLRKLRFRGQGREFESLREFVEGDPIRHVAWTATARRGKLVTREFQAERNQTLLILVDAGRMMTARVGNLTKLDHAVYAALGLACAATARGDRVGLTIFCRSVEDYLAPRAGSRQLARIMEALSDVQPKLIESDYPGALEFVLSKEPRRALVVLLTDIVDRESSGELIAVLARAARRHLPLLLAMRDANLDSLLEQTPRNVTEVYQQSVAEELRFERATALGQFIHAGGIAVDCDPSVSARQLIQRYLEIKERGQL